MQSRKTITGLDIGSHKICCAMGRIGPEGELILSGMADVPSEGVKNGVIIDTDRAAARVAEVLKRIEEKTGLKPSPLYVSISGDHMRGLNSRGAISISMIEGEITEEEVVRVVDLAKNVRTPEDQERLHVIPQLYAIDDRDGVRDPVGLSGERLEVEVHIVTASMSAAEDVLECVRKAGGTVQEMIYSPIASSHVLLTPEEKRTGAILLDIGSGTVDASLHYQDTIWQTVTVPLGGRNVTSDIAYGLRLPFEAAEEIKICQGSALVSRVNPKEKLTLPDQGEFYQRRISRAMLAAIIEPRMEETFTFVRNHLEKSAVYEDIQTVVMTGGGSCLRNVEHLVEQVFGVPAHLAEPRLSEDEVFYANPYGGAVAVGLIKYGYNQVNPLDADRGFFGRMSQGFEKVVNMILNI